MNDVDFKHRLGKFAKHLKESDALQIIVRGHLYIEAELIELISESMAMVNPKAIDIADLSFRKKVELAISLGLLKPEEKKSFLELNALRNKVAHNLDIEIGSENAKKLYMSFSKFFKHLYGKEPKSFTKFRVILRQCVRVMWVHLNQGRINQHNLKLKIEAQNREIKEIADEYRRKNPDYDPST